MWALMWVLTWSKIKHRIDKKSIKKYNEKHKTWQKICPKIWRKSSILGLILSQFWGHFGTHLRLGATLGPRRLRCIFRTSIFEDFVSKWGPDWDPFRVFFWDWFLALFWNPLFSFFWENGSPKLNQNGVPFWDGGPSSNVINRSKISLFGALDGDPFLGPRPRPLQIRRGPIFEDFWGPQKYWNGVYFCGFFSDPFFGEFLWKIGQK